MYLNSIIKIQALLDSIFFDFHTSTQLVNDYIRTSQIPILIDIDHTTTDDIIQYASGSNHVLLLINNEKASKERTSHNFNIEIDKLREAHLTLYVIDMADFIHTPEIKRVASFSIYKPDGTYISFDCYNYLEKLVPGYPIYTYSTLFKGEYLKGGIDSSFAILASEVRVNEVQKIMNKTLAEEATFPQENLDLYINCREFAQEISNLYEASLLSIAPDPKCLKNVYLIPKLSEEQDYENDITPSGKMPDFSSTTPEGTL